MTTAVVFFYSKASLLISEISFSKKVDLGHFFKNGRDHPERSFNVIIEASRRIPYQYIIYSIGKLAGALPSLPDVLVIEGDFTPISGK